MICAHTHIYPMDPSTFLGSAWGMIWGLSTLSGSVWIHRDIHPLIKVHRIVLSPVLTLTTSSHPPVLRPSMEPMLPEGSEPHRQRGRPRERHLGRRSSWELLKTGGHLSPPKMGRFSGDIYHEDIVG